MRIPTAIRARKHGINMTPMIDVVFLLIIFFLVSSHLARQDAAIQVDLPVAASADEDPATSRPRLTLTLQDDGNIYLGMRSFPLAEVTTRIQSAQANAGDDLEVRIRASRDLPWQQVEPLIVQLAKAGIWNVTFAVYDRERN